MGWILRTFRSRNKFFMKTMWKQILQPHVDYCSQLYFPGQSVELEKLETLQRVFTRKISEVKHMNYWDRLRALNLKSQERRLERYRILYTWKVIEGLVPNCGVQCYTSERNGRLCKIPPIKTHSSQKVKTLREKSFTVNGPILFNSLPKTLRNLSKCSIDDFKIKLDKYLETVPDQPKTSDLTPFASNQFDARPSNSIVDQIRRLQINAGG